MEIHESVLYLKGESATPQIAAFDLDGTLITTGGYDERKRAATSTPKWGWLFPMIPERLKELHTFGQTIVIFSNQNNVLGQWERRELLETKIREVVKGLGFKPWVYISCEHNRFRKPATGMWDLFCEHHRSGGCGREINKATSFFVGDAMRIDKETTAQWGYSNDDLFFATNIGLKISMPVDFFINNKFITASNVLSHNSAGSVQSPADAEEELVSFANYFNATVARMRETKAEVEIGGVPRSIAIFMVGAPASGKSTLVDRVFSEFVCINQDCLKTKSSTQKAVKEAVVKGLSVVIDKTFVDPAARVEYLNLIPVNWIKIAVNLSVTRHYAQHMNWVRAISQRIPCIEKIVYATYYKRFKDPEKSEGFDAILNYIPTVSEDDPIVPLMYKCFETKEV